MSEAGENSQAKLPVSSPVSGREILGLTSSPLTEGGKCTLGERVGRHVNVERGGFLLGMCAHIPLFILSCVCFMAINCLSVNFSQPCSELWNYEQSEEPQKSSIVFNIFLQGQQSAAAARSPLPAPCSPIYPKISLLKSPSDIIWLFTDFSGARDNAAGHVMDMGCQGGLSSREQNQRPSAQSGIAVLTIIMRTAMQPRKALTSLYCTTAGITPLTQFTRILNLDCS
ncbi:hypothetical protein G5714_010059 [Onychostoma macrolepis]|uniref:Uncharacterized protein n=1 Tax=Onychostoma macrolepis TaxID=369639 RepID=A0A7J6CP45_9TELE|nr:hypothetical protein G5714_010059 [Onychostoma macrolepis]